MTIESWAEQRAVVVYANDGAEIRMDCPLCEDTVGKVDTKQHLHISLQRPVAHCFRCGWGGTHISLIMQVDGCSFADALVELGDTPLPSVHKFDITPEPLYQSQCKSEPDGYISFDRLQKGNAETAAVWTYLVRKRRILIETVMKCMGVVPGSFRAWIMVDKGFWQGRTILSAEPKYINPPWPKGEALWNAEALRFDHVIICEGVFSVIAAGRQAIALCGKSITKQQAARIVKHYRDFGRPSELTLMLDSDAYGDALDVAQALEMAGYTGKLVVHKLLSGDPTDGLLGSASNFDWSSRIRYGLG